MNKIDLIIFILLIPLVPAINITEVYYDPPGYDNNLEFIELFLENKSLNLSGYIVADSYSDDNLTQVKYINSSYALIVEDGFDYSNLNCSIYTVGNAIGNNLNNDADEIKLFSKNGSLLDFMSYFQEVFGNTSLQLYNSSWELYEPTPCFELIINDSNFENITTNETINNSCDYSLSISADKLLYFDETIKFKHQISPDNNLNFTITYLIQDLYGSIIKKPYLTSNLNQKSFTPKAKGTNVYNIISYLNITSCNDSNQVNNNASFLFIHKSSQKFICPSCYEKYCPECSCSCPSQNCPSYISSSKNYNTSIKIIDVSFSNNTIFTNLFVTKGNTRKKLIEIYVKSGRYYITETKKIYMNQNNEKEFFNLNLEMKNLSNKKFDFSNLTLYAHGLGIKINESFLIIEKNESSKEIETHQCNCSSKNEVLSFWTSPLNPKPKEILRQLSNEPITSKVIYESSSIKQKNLTLPFFLILSIVLNIFYILKKL